MSRKVQLVLACLLVAGVAGCTGTGERTAVDPCDLLTAKDLVASRRFVTLSQDAVPTDVCEFMQVSERGDSVLEVGVTVNHTQLTNNDQSHPIDDLGDEAYYLGDGIVARRGDTRLHVKRTIDGSTQPGPPEPLVIAARQALDRLPEDASVPGLVAEGPCAQVDRSAVAAALGSRVGYSRSRSSNDQDSCVFTTDRGQRAELTLTKHPDGRKATDIQRRAPKLDLPGVDAYWYLGEVLVYGSGQELSIDAQTRDLTPELSKLVNAAVKAYRMRQTTPSSSPSGGTDPCALLSPEQAGRLDFSARKPTPFRVVSRAVWTYGDNVPVDTCGYERYRVVAGERPDLEVGIAPGHYDPVVEDDDFPKPRQPVDGLGDRAYFVHDSDEGWLVVERGQAQLTLHSELSYQDESATVQARQMRAAREALTKLPTQVEVAATVTDPACSRAGAAVAGAVGARLRYTRGVASQFAATCTYTMTNGTVAQIGVERGLTDEDLQKRREDPTSLEVFGARSMLTVSVHEPGKRAFPSDLGPDDVALAKAVKPLLD
jgi:hypothetical protein